MRKIIFVFLCCLLANINGMVAQNSLTIEDVIPIIYTENDSTFLEPTDLVAQPFQLRTCVRLSDTTNIQNIHLKIGRQYNAADVANVSIAYNYSSLPTGVTNIEKDGSNFIVYLGTYTNIYTLHLEVWTEDINGNLSQVLNKRMN